MLHCFRPTTLALALLLGAGAAQAADAPADAAPLANGSSAPLPLDELRTFAEVLDRVKAAYVEPVDDKTLLENAIKGMLSNLDPHSAYLGPEDFAELQESTSGEFGGLGIEVGSEDGFIKVVSPIDDTPAARAGIQPGDLIVQIGNWVLREACATAASWPGEVMVSVNVSPAQFMTGDIVWQVREALRLARLDARRLELEVTENVMLNDVDGALRTMTALKELGVRLNMDDFGTGYSSLGYLRTYPFDSIKIDKRFVASMEKTGRDRSIVQAIINLGNALNLRVTAEGVETEGQMHILRDEQCHELQGFLLSRPLDAQGLRDLLAREAGQTQAPQVSAEGHAARRP